MAKKIYTEQEKKDLLAQFEASGLSINAFVKTIDGPSYPGFKRWVDAAKGQGSKAKATSTNKALNIDSILADSIAQLKAGKQGLLNQKDALQQQLKDIDAEIIKINAALEKLS
ncbi:hypothetical protein M1D96_05465 [Pseudomonas sp. D1-3]